MHQQLPLVMQRLKKGDISLQSMRSSPIDVDLLVFAFLHLLDRETQEEVMYESEIKVGYYSALKCVCWERVREETDRGSGVRQTPCSGGGGVSMELCTKGEAVSREVVLRDSLHNCLHWVVSQVLELARSVAALSRRAKVRRSKETNGDERLWCMLLRI